MARQLATIQTIKELAPIEGKDRIKLCSFESIGWHCIVDTSYKEGDMVVYVEPDSILPEKPEYEFLRPRCWNALYNGFRIKSMKMSGVVSEGICFKIRDVLPDYTKLIVQPDGYDVTAMLGVVKYDPEALEEEKLVLAKGKKYGPFVNYLLKFAFFRWLLLPKRKRPGKWPDFVSKTDETRVQNLTYVFDKYQGLPVYVTVKKDGQSVTFFYNKKEFGVCSRNLRLPRPQKLKGEYVTEQSKYWQSAEKYDVEAKLKKASKELGINLYIQAESCGPGIQGNKCKYKELKLFVFNVYDITHKKYFGYVDLIAFCKSYGFDTVPIYDITTFDWKSSDELVEYAKGFDPDGVLEVLREGVVIRSLLAMPPDKGMTNMWSLKVINPDFSVKWGQNDYSEKK
jgi:hypothetical protein